MKFLKGNGRRRLLFGLLALLLLLSAGAMTLTSPASAASSKELQQELDKLRAQQSDLRKQSSELESEIKENQKQTQTVIEQKYDIDRVMGNCFSYSKSLRQCVCVSLLRNSDFCAGADDIGQQSYSHICR